MNLLEQVLKVKELIIRGKSLGKDVTELEEYVLKLDEALKHEIEQIKLYDLKDRDIAIQIYSEPLCCDIWFCSNDELASQVKRDDSDSYYYTARELINIFKLNPDIETIKSIHSAKTVFQGSKVIKSKRAFSSRYKQNMGCNYE